MTTRRLHVALVAAAAVAAMTAMLVFVLDGTGADGDRGRGSSEAAELKPFTAADARFRAAFPGTPKRTEQDIPAGGSSLRLIQYTAESGGNRGFSVGWFQLASAPDPNAVRPFLEATQRGSVAAVKGTLLTSTFVKQDGHDAVEYVARLSGGGYVKSRTVLVGQDVYVIQVVGPESDPERYDEFIESFEVVPAG